MRVRFLPAAFAVLLVLGNASFAQSDARSRLQDAIEVYRNGRLEEAITTLEALHQEFPDEVDVQAWLGFVYLRAERPRDAVPVLRKAREQRPDDLEILNNLGNAYLGADQLDEALEQFLVLAQKGPARFEPWYNIGNIHLRREAWTEAVKAFETAATLKPGDPYVHNNLGVALEAAGRLPAAAANFGKASTIDPENVVFARNTAFVLLRNREPARALLYLERAYRLDPRDLSVGMALGEVYSRTGDAAKAANVFQSLSTFHADSATVWFNLGVARAQSGDRANAERAYRKALELTPNDIDVLNNLGLLLLPQNAEEAKTLFARLIALDQETVTGRLNLAAAALRTDDLALAVNTWKEVLTLAPETRGVRLNLANGLWKLGAYDEAAPHYEAALREAPTNHEALNGMGLVELHRNDPRKAEGHFRAAIRANERFAPAYNNLAVALERLQNRAEAIRMLQEAIRIDPNYEEARLNLRRIRSAGN